MDILSDHSAGWLLALILSLVATGIIAGLMAGLLGVGGGIDRARALSSVHPAGHR
jgi:uncharacterized membrane protein YfcA